MTRIDHTGHRLRPVTIEAQPYNAETPAQALCTHDITPNGSFYVRNHFAVPQIALVAWRLKIGGAVAHELALTLNEIKTLPARTVTATLECAGNGRTHMRPLPPGAPWQDGAVGTATWTGVPLRQLLDRAEPRDGAREVLFQGADQGLEGGQRLAFERSLPLKDAQRGDVLVAYRMNGRPLPALHGSPLRLIVPGWYGVASVKWLARITVLTAPFEGWYMAARYIYADAKRASPTPVRHMQVKSLITEPLNGTTLHAGHVCTVSGLAWSGSGLIREVAVRLNDAKWHKAKLSRRSFGRYAWRRWSINWKPTSPGRYLLTARASDNQGNIQPLEPVWNFYGYGYNYPTPTIVHAV